tara:strand:+ start:123090 stop:123302 length:213 start_codon:yes stop_codon:yes gene_type:complete
MASLALSFVSLQDRNEMLRAIIKIELKITFFMLLVLEINMNLIPIYTQKLEIKTIFMASRLKKYVRKLIY